MRRSKRFREEAFGCLSSSCRTEEPCFFSESYLRIRRIVP